MAAFLVFMFIFLGFNLVTSPIAAAHQDGLSRDRAALLSFHSGVAADPENALANWGSGDASPCNWTGVTCNHIKHRVIQLNLTSRGLQGVISPALANLSFLSFLDLSDNLFGGFIPPALGSLPRLKELSLSSNLLEGSVPAELGFLGELVYLALGSNRLTGPIPENFFCNSTSLQYLDLSNNSLTGKITLGNQCRLSDLRFLLLFWNKLEGPIPLALSNSSKLRWVELESNFLTSELPYEVFDKLPYLQYLQLSHNNLSSHDLSPFLASLRNCSHLEELELAGNNLGGEIPPLVGDLSTSLLELDLGENHLTGLIPRNMSNLVNLTYLDLSNNFLNGSIPQEICRLTSLQRVYISNNHLSGEIPPSLGQIRHLGILDISGNRLSGSIPETLTNLSALWKLMLYKNQLSGAIPTSLGSWKTLALLDLSYNRLTGMIPGNITGLIPSMNLYLNVSNNLLQGSLPLELSKMQKVMALDFSSNKFSGAIPQLGGCVALEHLNLSSNALQDSIPSSIGTLPSLISLDLASNQLVGALPESLQSSSSLKQLNISFNNLSGQIPTVGVFASLTADSYLGNPSLCGPVKGLSACNITKQPHKHAVLPIVLLVLTGASCCLLCLVGYPLMKNRLRMKPRLKFLQTSDTVIKDEELKQSSKIDHPRISYQQLVEATGGFSESNLIGWGRFGHVYKGVLKDEMRIAVKVLNPKIGTGGISGSFKRECQVLKRTRHRNLVRVITACSMPDFKALVLPLMANGNLDSHLYPREEARSTQRLSLVQLVSIASDIAEGVAYLHHYSPVRVVHCDLKPSNVLLDDDMTAVVSDFGIARLVKGGDHQNFCSIIDDSASCIPTTGLLYGSVGYIAPEYGLGGLPSTQGDVYSFGVLLLEIVTGKRPTDIIFHEGLTMQEWVKNHYPHDISSIISNYSWLNDSPLSKSLELKKPRSDVISELIELGLVCTHFSPSMRPTMVDVAHEMALLKLDLPTYGISESINDNLSSVPDCSF